MAEIKVLPQNIADKIAAGEVAERPSAVVKELVENSIDAGADSIQVEIENGGVKCIRVTDNGCGIECDRLADIIAGKTKTQNECADDRKRNAGIGLSVCASIVKAHGSELQAENLTTGGARFSFALGTEDESNE